MITKIRFKKIKKGDFILTKNRVRKPSLRYVSFDSKNKNMIVLKRVNGSLIRGESTAYNYSDIGHKIIGIFTNKYLKL